MQHPLPLWPAGQVPGALGAEDADVPSITRFDPAPQKRNGAAIVVCPGGGYRHLAEHEGPGIGRWLAEHGVTAFVLKYRLAPRYKHPAMLQDVSRAMRTVRHLAAETGLDPQRIGVMGSSAGGHLAASVSNLGDDGDASAADPIERQPSRPDISVLLYPVIAMAEPFSHVGSRNALLGEDAPEELREQMSLERRVTGRTPPTFLFHTGEDPAVPVENALAYAGALRRNGVPFELHIYEQGPHGVGLAEQHPALRTWGGLCLNWLKLRRFVTA